MIHPMNKIVTISQFLLGGLCSQASSSTVFAKEASFVSSAYHQTAREIYNSGAMMRQVWMEEKDDAIKLFWGDVIENDSAICGRDANSPGEPFESLGKDILLRKVLTLHDAQAKEAYLAFVAREQRGHNAILRILVNGHETLRSPSSIATPKAQQYWCLAAKDGTWNWSRWYYVPIPIECLCTGENLVEISTVDGLSGWQIMVGDYANFKKGARPGETPAYASTKSTDGGKTWDNQHMGTQNAFLGEYVIRLAMRRYRKTGWIVSEVIDAANQQEELIKVPLRVQSVQMQVQADTPEDTNIDLSLRWGDTPHYQIDNWTVWEPVNMVSRFVNCSDKPVQAKGRYLQWKAELFTENPLISPALRSVRLVTTHESAPKQENLRVIAMDNPKIVRCSYDFPFERYNHPKLKKLRQACDLDKVVASAKDDWDMIKRLLRWAYLMPLPSCNICPWDVMGWMEIKRDEKDAIIVNQYDRRRRDKMCLYPNVLLAEMLMAVGIPARHVNINSEGMSGHEVCEAWSNGHRKWIQIDATRDFYWIDKKTREPLSTLEVHNELIRHLDKVETWEDPFCWRINDRVLEDKQIEGYGGEEWPYPLDVDLPYMTTAHFRIIPRNDYCQHPYPLPISQGSEVWGWDGYLNWADDMVPPLLHFSHHTNRPSDMYWTQNQTHLTLVHTGLEEILVFLETDMPNFASYERSIDGSEWTSVDTPFKAKLKSGVTELRVRAVNSIGLPGVTSRAAIEYTSQVGQ